MTPHELDATAYAQWYTEFETYLLDSGLSKTQALKYRDEFAEDALHYFTSGKSPGDAAAAELLGF